MDTVRIKLRRSLESGFLVTLYCQVKQQVKEIEGFLPLPPEELQHSFDRWQCAYRQIEAVRQQAEFRLTAKRVEFGCALAEAQNIKTHLNQWLNAYSLGWQTIRDYLIQTSAQLHPDIQIILDAKEPELRRLPWQEWNLLETYYPKAEVVLSIPKSVRDTQVSPHLKSRRAQILVVVGQSEGINTAADLDVIQKLESSNAKVVSLIQPTQRQLCEALWNNRGYHIFIYTGHSCSDHEGKIGWIDINDQEKLSIEDFKEALKEAISNGLQLAIFNSCDGLGLASQLAELNLSQCIVMREPVPDSVAVDFFKYFFKEFTQNCSLFAAMRRARKKLEYSNSSYPGAVWLPILCIKQGVVPMSWAEISTEPVQEIPPLPPKPWSQPQTLAQPQTLVQPHSSIRKFKQKNHWYFPMLGLVLVGLILGIGISLGVNQLTCKFNPAQCDISPPKPDSKEITLDSVETISGVWRYGGSTAWAAIRKQVDEQIKQVHPGFKLTYISHPSQPHSSGMGIQMVLNGQLSFSQSSRPLEDEEYEMAKQRGFELKQIPVAIDGIVAVVHPDLTVRGLTLEQLKNIYTGKITNWAEVGGPSLPIMLYASPEGSGSPMFMQHNLFAPGETFSPKLIRIDTPTEAISKIGRDRQSQGAIYMATAANLVGQCLVKPLPLSAQAGQDFIAPYQGNLASAERCRQQPNQINYEAFRTGQYPLTRRLFVIIKKDNQWDQEAGEAYAELLLTDEGQRLIQQAGFVPIRPVGSD